MRTSSRSSLVVDFMDRLAQECVDLFSNFRLRLVLEPGSETDINFNVSRNVAYCGLSQVVLLQKSQIKGAVIRLAQYLMMKYLI